MKYFVEVSGRSFGPFPVATIQNWVSSGRVTAESKVSSNKVEWKRADEFPELAPLFGKSGGSSPGATSDPDAAVWNLSVDGQTAYGPYRASDILQWIREGRVKGETLVWRQGENARQIMTEPYFALQFSAPTPPPGTEGYSSAVGSAVGGEEAEWYYSSDGIQGYGPYTISDILSFVAQGRANIDSVVWRQGENARRMRTEPAFSERLALASSGASVLTVQVPAQIETKLNKQLRFRHTALWIAVACSVALALVIFVYHEVKGIRPNYDALVLLDLYNKVEDTHFLTKVDLRYRFILNQTNKYYDALFSHGEAVVLYFLYGVATIVSCVFLYMFVYSFWKSIPPRVARCSPGRAVGFLFIPFFQLYWLFIAYVGGVRDMNKGFKLYESVGVRRGEKTNWASEGAAIVLALIFLFNLITGMFGFDVLVVLKEYVYLLYALTLILVPIFLTTFKNSAIQMNRWREESPDNGGNLRGENVTLDDLVNS